MILGGPKDPSDLEKEIARVIELMSNERPDSDEYAKMNKQLGALHERLMAQKPKPLDAGTVATISANLVGILLIVGHERAHVITSKAVGFVRTLR
jgi:hypothetical protein